MNYFLVQNEINLKTLVLTIMILFIIVLSNVGYTQNDNFSQSVIQSDPECLRKIINIKYEDTPLKKVLLDFVEKTKCYLNYNESIIPTKHRITLDIDNISAKQALKFILTGTNVKFVISVVCFYELICSY